jgi:hypothetical protein
VRSSAKLLVSLAASCGAIVFVQCSDPAPVGSDAGVDATVDAPAEAASDGAVEATVEAGPGCDDKNPCEAGTCCNGTCTNVAKDPKNCGACGVACSAAQFCNGTACVAAQLKNLCQNPKVAVILDGLSPDETAAAPIGAAMDGGCVPAVQVRNVLQNAPGVIDDAGRPQLGVGETWLATGGPFGQRAVGYVETKKNAPIYGVGDSTSFSFVRTADDGLITKIQNVDLTAKHDWFAVYLAPEPTLGTLVFAVYGILNPGTAAASWFVTNVIFPNRASYDKQYYVYEWVDADDAGTPNAPDANDTFKLLGSGP